MLANNYNSNSAPRTGFSLIEVMIAMVMTLIVLGAMMAAFSYGSRAMHRGRAIIDLSSRLQAADALLRSDLDRITVDVRPHHFQTQPPNGYLEIVDGPRRDYNGSDYTIDEATLGNNSHLGDNDDYISFTIKSESEGIRGATATEGMNASHYAEVHWYIVGDTLYRKLRLIRPEILGEGTANLKTELADLGYRGARRFHRIARDPHGSTLERSSFSTQTGDIVLTNVIAFDIQVYDPTARRYVVRAGTGPSDPIIDVADPSEIGAVLGVANGEFSSVAPGAFVDLGKGTSNPGTFPILFNPPQRRYTGEAVYDTGTSQYNHDDVNDSGKNGVDDVPYVGIGFPNGIIDDVTEKASIPPYNVPLRGIKISIRALEPNTKQVRQMTIIKSFVKE